MVKIVVLKSSAPLDALFHQNGAEVALASIQNAASGIHGVTFLRGPVRVPAQTPPGKLLVVGDHHTWASGHHYAYEVRFDSPDAETDLSRKWPNDIVGIYANPTITQHQVCFDANAIGHKEEVRRQLRLTQLPRGVTGKGIRVAVVDSGVSRLFLPVHDGFARPGFQLPGDANPEHGTMVAVDAHLAAPDSRILDIPLFPQTGGTPFQVVLMDALIVYSHLHHRLAVEPGPMVVVNSWGMSDRERDDMPEGTPQNYGANPHHIVTVGIAALVAAGADVFFSAGNCGCPCPFAECGAGDTGPGRSIHGANSHADIVSVGAVTVLDERLGYSSEGPGRLASEKPDLCASSHFTFSQVFEKGDTGTSAACAVAAGVAAALRSSPQGRNVSPARLKQVLIATARQPAGIDKAWNAQTGHGVINAAEALRNLP